MPATIYVTLYDSIYGTMYIYICYLKANDFINFVNL